MEWYQEFDQAVADFLPDLKVVCDEPMSKYTTFRIGGPAKRMAFPDRAEQVVILVDLARKCGARPLVMGNGSNLLVPDEGLDRLVINTTGGMTWMEVGPGGETILVEAGASLAKLAVFACEQGLSGLEFAYGIPGTVGGALYMNAGAYDEEIGALFHGGAILFPNTGIEHMSQERMEFSYRHSILTENPEAVLLYVVLKLEKGEPAAIREKMDQLMERRKASQPLDYPSAGSVFKRPEGHFAGALIEESNLKGLTVGGAQVSEKHAGFIVNCGNATCADVKELIRQVQEAVLAKTGVALEPEIKMIEA